MQLCVKIIETNTDVLCSVPIFFTYRATILELRALILLILYSVIQFFTLPYCSSKLFESDGITMQQLYVESIECATYVTVYTNPLLPKTKK